MTFILLDRSLKGGQGIVVRIDIALMVRVRYSFQRPIEPYKYFDPVTTLNCVSLYQSPASNLPAAVPACRLMVY